MTYPSKEILTYLKKLLLNKGYPEGTLFFSKIFEINLHNLYFKITLPLLVTHQGKTLLILDYHPSRKGLSSFERALLAKARLLFEPPPYLAYLTNLSEFICIEVYANKSMRGGDELLVDFKTLTSYEPPFMKPYKRNLEEKILALYLSGGCELE